MKTAAIVYHRADFDGICSYAIAKAFYEANGYRVYPFPYNYGDDAPDSHELVKHDVVLIADICLPAWDMVCLMHTYRYLEGYRSFIWIDHHKTSIEESVREGFSECDGIREVGRCGACLLTWEYLHPGEEAPLAVRLLAAYDVWDKKAFPWEERTLPFQYGMRAAFALRAEDFCRYFKLMCTDEAYIQHVTEKGAAILSYERENGEVGVFRHGFPVKVAGEHKGICLLTPHSGMIPFENRLKLEGASIAVCVNRITADLYSVSLLGTEGNTLDLGGYLKEHYRGGGHFNAAGGRLYREEFIRLITDCVI